MKTIFTNSFLKIAEKNKEWDPNPWAVCHTTVDKDEDPDKYEGCVHHVKKKQKKSKSKEASGETKPNLEGIDPAIYKQKEHTFTGKLHRQRPRPRLDEIDPNMSDDEWLRLVQKYKDVKPDPVLASKIK